MTEVQVSTEEHIRDFLSKDMGLQELLALDPTLAHQDDHLSVDNTCVPYDGIESIDPKNCNIRKDDFDIYFPMLEKSKDNRFNPSDHLAIEHNNKNMWVLFEQNMHIDPQPSIRTDHVILSQSVGVTMPKKYGSTSGPIQIVNDLEEGYKARYKSDYFSQDGKNRPPRYVADRLNNHFVSIRFLSGTQGYIRIDWVTIPNKQNVRFSMPYKFQVSNESINVPDENPTYKPINTDASGLMKNYLVLIKSKQSELKDIQPLQVFPPVSEKNHFTPMTPLSPKRLIEQYQLDQSQLAFTYCILGFDGKTYIPDWSTTVYSTVMTEKPDEPSKKRKISCPNCSHSFQITIDIADDEEQETVIKKRKS